MSTALQSGTHRLEKGFDFPAEHRADGASLMPEPHAAHTRVLQISDDLNLANSRRLILRRAGYQVEIKSRREFWAATEDLDYRAIVLCQSISPGEAYAIAMAVMTHTHVPPIVRFSNGEEMSAAAFHCLLQAPALPEAFCRAVSSAMAAC